MAGTQRHAHGPAPGADARWLSAALALIVAFMAGEIAAGLASHSLALISDAAHMLTDAAAIALVLVTARLAARPPTGGYTYGLKRTEIMSAQANGITLVLLAAWLCYTAIRRLLAPHPVAGGTVLGVALAGVAVNVAATLLIARASGRGRKDRKGDNAHGPHHGHGGQGPPQSLNVAGAFQHILTDLYAFAATAVAGLIILLTGFVRADAIATLVVVALMVHAGFTGIDDILSGADNYFLAYAPNADQSQLTAELGTRFEIVRTGIKKWPAGSPIQAPLDAMENIFRKRKVDPNDVKSVVVCIAHTEARVVDNREMPDICLQHLDAEMLIEDRKSVV